MKNIERDKQVKFYVNDKELALIDKRVQELKFSSRGAYLRKTAIDGMIINVDMSAIKSLTNEINHIGTNVNQIAHKCNERGITYYDLDEIKRYMEKIWQLLRSMLSNIQSARQSITSETLKRLKTET